MVSQLPERFAYWHGIEREKIEWFPAIDENKCIGCKLCFISCGRDVFDLKKNKENFSSYAERMQYAL